MRRPQEGARGPNALTKARIARQAPGQPGTPVRYTRRSIPFRPNAWRLSVRRKPSAVGRSYKLYELPSFIGMPRYGGSVPYTSTSSILTGKAESGTLTRITWPMMGEGRIKDVVLWIGLFGSLYITAGFPSIVTSKREKVLSP